MHTRCCHQLLQQQQRSVTTKCPAPLSSTVHHHKQQQQPCRTQRVACAAAAAAAAGAAAAVRAAVGIDLGTTNSVVAVLREGETHPTVIHDPAAATFTVPSVVAYQPTTGNILVGAAARDQAATNPLNTYDSVKRLIGRSWGQVQGLGLVYELQEGQDGGVQLVCPAKATHLSPQEVSSQLLRHLVDLASQHLSGTTPQQVVVTVPAYFNAQQRAATIEAAHLAGIQQVSLLQEPVAAAMAFGFGKPYDAETLLVFDLGGGTFDLSVVESFEGIMEVLATGGDALLGGGDFDRAILRGLLIQQEEAAAAAAGAPAEGVTAAGSSGSSDSSGGSSNSSSGGGSSSSSSISPHVLVELLEAVEAAKCQLSTQESVYIPLSPQAAAYLTPLHRQQEQMQQQQQQQAHHHSHEQQQQQHGHEQQQQHQQEPGLLLTQQQMHLLTAGLRQRLWAPLQQLADACKLEYACNPHNIEQQLQQQGQPPAAAAGGSNGSGSDGGYGGSNGSSSEDKYAPKPRQLTAVLLVGGATRMPILQRGLQILTGLQPRSDVDPEQAVAIGAAIQAAVLLGLSSGVELMDGSYVEELHDRSTGF